MTDAPAERTFVYRVIIPHASEPRIVLLRDAAGWSLPHWETTERRPSAAAEYVNHAVRDLLGVDVTMLRCLPHDPNPATGRVERTYVMENHSPDWEPPSGGRWVTSGDLDHLTLAVPTQHDLLLRLFAEAEEGVIPPLRAPWARPGWYQTAIDWIRARLTALGLTATGSIEKVHVRTVSCVLRVPTTAGDLYFKARSPTLRIFREPLFTHYLAQRYPAHVPEVLAIDTERSWMLMRDFGGTQLRHVREFAPWEHALRLLARMQAESVEHVHDLLAAGFPDRRLDILAGQINEVLAYAAAMPSTWRDALSPAELDALFALAPRLRQMCKELAGYRVPHTLVHGDCHAGNITLAGERLVVFDWADGSVAHPFFILLPFFRFYTWPDVPDARARLEAVYLQAWTAYEPWDRLLEAVRISQTLAALHQAVSYYWGLTHIEPDARWEYEATLPYHLRMLLPGGK